MFVMNTTRDSSVSLISTAIWKATTRPRSSDAAIQIVRRLQDGGISCMAKVVIFRRNIRNARYRPAPKRFFVKRSAL
jgi:predicted DCC family thiol-disulfide oxidoreductase YuxK